MAASSSDALLPMNRPSDLQVNAPTLDTSNLFGRGGVRLALLGLLMVAGGLLAGMLAYGTALLSGEMGEAVVAGGDTGASVLGSLLMLAAVIVGVLAMLSIFAGAVSSLAGAWHAGPRWLRLLLPLLVLAALWLLDLQGMTDWLQAALGDLAAGARG